MNLEKIPPVLLIKDVPTGRVHNLRYLVYNLHKESGEPLDKNLRVPIGRAESKGIQLGLNSDGTYAGNGGFKELSRSQGDFSFDADCGNWYLKYHGTNPTTIISREGEIIGQPNKEGSCKIKDGDKILFGSYLIRVINKNPNPKSKLDLHTSL